MKRSKHTRRGTVIWWMMGTMITLCMIISLGVDLGRVQLAKTELRCVADGAARAGASGMGVSLSEAVLRARTVAQANKVDGGVFDINTSKDVEFGKWDAGTRKFTKLAASQFSQADSVRVITRKTAAQNGPVKLLFASVMNKSTQELNAEAIVKFIAGVKVDQPVQGTANPFLAGMPAGSVASLNNPHNSPDYAGTAASPRQSPIAVPMKLYDKMVLNFDSIEGVVRHDPNLADYNPDGQLDSIGRNTNGSENGISDLISPINALVGVFLSDNQPNLTSAPTRLDFSSAASRDFDSLEPKLKQIFFIGDGMNSKGKRQEFVVPEGATRLYLATWDFFEWNNNSGQRTVKVYRPDKIITVK